MSPLAAQGGSARDHGCDIINAEEHTRVFAFEHKGDVFSQKCPIKTRLGSIKMCVKMSPLSWYSPSKRKRKAAGSKVHIFISGRSLQMSDSSEVEQLAKRERLPDTHRLKAGDIFI